MAICVRLLAPWIASRATLRQSTTNSFALADLNGDGAKTLADELGMQKVLTAYVGIGSMLLKKDFQGVSEQY